MSRKLDYNSKEYDELLRQARKIGWNDEGLSSRDRQKEIDNFTRSLDRSKIKMRSTTYLTINKFKDKIEICANIKDEKLEKEKVDATVKQIVKIIRRNKLTKKNIIINTNLNLQEDEKKDNQKLTLIVALNACKIKNKNERLEYIYMSACKYLDNEFINNNICEFHNDICLCKRAYNVKDGCCHEMKLKDLFHLKNLPTCKYQKNGVCTADCLGCKLFSCNAVHKKGFNYTYYNVALVRYFFNIVQKIIIRSSVFTHKDQILKRLYLFNF